MKVELNDERWPKGTEFHIAELGTLVNGKTVEFSAEEIEQFETATGTKVAQALKGIENANVDTSAKGGGD